MKLRSRALAAHPDTSSRAFTSTGAAWCCPPCARSGACGQLTTRVQKYAADAGGGGGKEVFPPMARLDWRRRASFAGLSADPFHLTLSYTGSPTPCCLPEGGKYVTYTVTGLKDVLAQHDDTQDVLARFHLDGNGMVKITHVEALRVFNETETTSKQVVDEEAGAPRWCTWQCIVVVPCCAAAVG